ncbi:hypothetical protein C0995_011936 [Termitomyces sp. Mi166|nr:hypothetical protein C0995_011936 [Termitomyces sp. Mi166\
MLRKQVPDLDSLESPLISANPFGSILGVVPGSALAERIFNDPNSWHGADDDGDLIGAEAMKWLADEIDKCQASGEELVLSPVDRDMDIMLKSLTEKLNFAVPTASENLENWNDTTQETKPPFQPLFNHTSLDLSVDLRFSKIWDAKGNMFHPLQSPILPANGSKSLPSVAENASIVAPTALDLGAVDNTLSPIMSPLTVASASTTWSILELYGVHPNTPRIHGCISAPSTNATVTAPSVPPPVPETTSIRRLPIIPDESGCTTFSPPPSRTSTPSRGSTPECTSQRTNSPLKRSPQYVKTHERSVSATTTPKRSTSRSRRKPRGSATPPAPSGSPDPLNLNSSPNVTPSRSGDLLTRSPPAGPRPRSAIRQRQASGRGSPSPIVIEPAPTRARKPSPPPGLYLGAPA